MDQSINDDGDDEEQEFEAPPFQREITTTVDDVA